MNDLKAGILQLNFIVGDLQKNAEKILRSVKNLKCKSPDLIIAPELSIWGYPPKDLLLDEYRLNKSAEVLLQLCKKLKTENLPPLVLGIPEKIGHGKTRKLFNAAVLLRDGKSEVVARKNLLPNYTVFNERRYFDSDSLCYPVQIGTKKILFTICEDLWGFSENYDQDSEHQKRLRSLTDVKFDAMINLSASPFEVGKQEERIKIVASFSNRYSVPVIYCNAVGGNDGLVFDGRSFLFNKGQIKIELPAFEEAEEVISATQNGNHSKTIKFTREEEIYHALKTGIRDYIKKSGFRKVVLGLSGGIDSAVVCALATEALGAKNVFPILMPSQFSSEESINDSLKLAENLELKTKTISIAPILTGFLFALNEEGKETVKELTEENLQPRIRANLLMAFSGELNALLLATGNKSELAVGYCTIYGDMCGALAVIADLWKTEVYALAQFINRKQEIIPEAILTKAPSAELKPDQTDQDNLPEYKILDAILKLYIEERLSPDQISQKGFESSVINNLLYLLKMAEFKRIQAPPMIRVSSQSLGIDRQMPLATHYS